MLTYAINDKTSFKNLEMWRKEFSYYADLKESSQVPFIVVGNKVYLYLINQFNHEVENFYFSLMFR